MRVAVPLFEGEVAPRFGFANEFLLVDIVEEQVENRHNVTISNKGWPNRLNELKELGVEVILSGGFNRCYMPLAEELGIQVVAGLAGNALETSEAFARGEAKPAFRYCGQNWSASKNGMGCARRRNGRGNKGKLGMGGSTNRRK